MGGASEQDASSDEDADPNRPPPPKRRLAPPAVRDAYTRGLAMAAIGTSDSRCAWRSSAPGRSGFYAAGHLLKSKSHPDLCVQVDMFDRLPTPWGLVRAGVAPDHPNIKAVSRVYEKTAEHPEFRFYGNVELGRDLSHEDLTARYHAVIYAVGAQTDRRMGIPARTFPGAGPPPSSWPGTTAIPTTATSSSTSPPSAPWWSATATWPPTWPACSPSPARSSPRPTWPITRSRCSPESNVREIVVLGRRGPAQAAFTNPELLELGEMTDADVFVDPGDAELDPLSKAFIESEAAHTTAKKNVDILERLRRARAARQAPPHRAALPRLAAGDPRRASASRASASSTTSSWRTTAARFAPVRPT